MLSFLILCLALPYVTFANVSWEDCGSADRSFVFKKVDIPSPLTISSTQPLTMDLSIDLLDPLDTEVQMDAELRRYFSILGFQTSVKIPCVNDVGSCSGSFCYFVESYANLARTIAGQLNVPFTCELSPISINGNVTYSVPTTTFTKIPSAILSAASGDYELVVRWRLDSREIGCLAIRTNINILS